MNVSWLTFAVAEAVCLISRARDFTVVFKSKSQRTRAEQTRINQGLTRDLLGDLLIFVPASAFVVVVTIGPLVPAGMASHPAIPGLLGVMSFGFPLKAIRMIAYRIALNSLREFKDVLTEAQQDGAKVASIGGEHV